MLQLPRRMPRTRTTPSSTRARPRQAAAPAAATRHGPAPQRALACGAHLRRPAPVDGRSGGQAVERPLGGPPAGRAVGRGRELLFAAHPRSARPLSPRLRGPRPSVDARQATLGRPFGHCCRAGCLTHRGLRRSCRAPACFLARPPRALARFRHSLTDLLMASRSKAQRRGEEGRGV